MISAFTIPAFTPSGSYTAYNNRILADGIVLSKTSDLTTNSDPITRYPAKPLILIVRLEYSNAQYTIGNNNTPLYNPRNLSVTCNRTNVGTLDLTHNIGHSNYSICGAGINGNKAYVSFTNRGNTGCTILISDDSTTNDYPVEIMVFDYNPI